MPEVDAELATALKQAKTKPMNFVFVAKGAADGALLVDKAKIPPKKVTTAKTEIGGGAIFRGRCFTEDGVLIFEMAQEPPAALAAQLKKIITRDAGLGLKVAVRAGGSEEEEGETPTDSEEGVDPNAARFQEQLQQSAKELEALAATAPDKAKPLQAMLALARKRDQEKNYAQGLVVLKELDARLQALQAASPGSAPVTEDGGAAFASRLKGVAPSYMKALQAGGPHAVELKALFAEVNDLAKKKDFVGANAALDRLVSLVTSALAPPPSSEYVDMYQGLLETINEDLPRLRKDNPAVAEQVQKVVDAAKGLAQKGDYQKACTFLDQATKAIAKATAKANVTDAAKDAPDGKVAAAVLRSELQQVRLQAAQGVDDLESALRATGDARALQVAAIVKRLAHGFPTKLESILEQLDAAVTARDADRAKALRGEVQLAAKEWLAYLQTNADYVHGCETNPWKLPVHIADPIKKSLAAILKSTR